MIKGKKNKLIGKSNLKDIKEGKQCESSEYEIKKAEIEDRQKIIMKSNVLSSVKGINRN